MRLHPAGAAPDALAGAVWECLSCPPDTVAGPEALSAHDGRWMPALVPGTAAASLRVQGKWTWGDDDRGLFDGSDWWYRCDVDVPDHAAGTWELEFGGLATVADVWLNGEHVLRSESMWLTHRVPVVRLAPHNVLIIRFAALDPLLAKRRPRPRWRSLGVRSQQLRWFRTTLLGRIPGWLSCGAPVGPWRPVRLNRIDAAVTVRECQVRADVDGGDGVVDVLLVVDGVADGTEATVRVGEVGVPTTVSEQDGRSVVEVRVRVPRVERWWPHTHGGQPRTTVRLEVGDTVVELPSVAFRTVSADREGGGFTLSVNGVPVFCRGANWLPPDAVGLVSPATEVRESLHKLIGAGMNMVRLAGYATYEDDVFWDACDELGILVWQDCMIAGYDPPEDPEFEDGLVAELSLQLGALRSHPSLAVVCGSSDCEQQAAMFGLPPDRRRSRVLDETIPGVVDRVLPGVPYVTSAPSGGELPFDPAVGVATYFGVGAYLRPVSDVRTAGVRFAAECLAFSTPPEPATVERAFGTARGAGHDPVWKSAVPRDATSSWDHEEIRDRYVAEVFGVDPFLVRYADPDRALDYGRAVVAQLMSVALSEWRCERSTCAGALILNWQDVGAGAGWGLLDAFGSPKAPWFAVRRVLAPLAVLLTDDGLSGLGIHVVNDGPEDAVGELRIALYDASGRRSEDAAVPVEVPGRSQSRWAASALVGGFRDLTDAYRFGPPAFDVVRVELEVGGSTQEAFHLPGGAGRSIEADLGLEATASRHGDHWQVTVRSGRFAQWVAMDTPGFAPGDSWFHLAPGSERTVALVPIAGDGPPRGRVRCLNGLHSVPITVVG